MAYETKFRERVMKFMAKGHTIAEASEVFEVGTTTIKEWKKLQKETGSLEKRVLKRKSKKIDPKKLTVYMNEHPDAFLREIAEVFGCSITAVFKALRKLKFTLKKN